MNALQNPQPIELRLTARYIAAHGWTVQAITGFLSAYFMEQPDFRVQRHGDDTGGAHVWYCEVPPTMKMARLIRRLQADIPRFSQQPPADQPQAACYVLDLPE